MVKVSRRQLAVYAADALLAGKNEVVEQLAAYLVETGRTNEVELLVRDIEKALSLRGAVVAHLASAYSLGEDQKTNIEALLSKRYGAKSIAMSTAEDDSLLGGVVLQVAGEELDSSLRRNINRLKAIKV